MRYRTCSRRCHRGYHQKSHKFPYSSRLGHRGCSTDGHTSSLTLRAVFKSTARVRGTIPSRFVRTKAITLNIHTRSTCHYIVELAVTHCRNTSLSRAALFFRHRNSRKRQGRRGCAIGARTGSAGVLVVRVRSRTD